MAPSIFLARLIGPVMLAVGLGGLLNRGAIAALAASLSGNPGAILAAGAIDLAIGLAIVLAHDVWAADWRVLVTLIGWFGLLRGLVRILAPVWLSRNAAPRLASGPLAPAALAATAAYGLALTVCGFMAAA